MFVLGQINNNKKSSTLIVKVEEIENRNLIWSKHLSFPRIQPTKKKDQQKLITFMQLQLQCGKKEKRKN